MDEDGAFEPGEPGTGMTTLFEGEWATVRRLRKGKLVVVAGADQGKEVEIAKPRVTGGRSIISDLVVQDKAVSGTHFEVSARDDGYRLRDLNSRNGIYVGDLRIREVFLRPGTVFRIGHTSIQFQSLEDVVEIELSKKDRFDAMLGASPAMREIFAQLEKVAPHDLTCLITGETGTGKEMVARALHNASGRKNKPFVVLDCGAIPRELIESTLFGHEKGSFTGAVAQHIGCFEQASGGTILLDEIGELDVMLQPKLLRVLEQREIKRVGGDRTHKVDVRVLAATNRDLRDEVNRGGFREDLYFRLSVVNCELPPLRDRREDIPGLVRHFVDLFSRENNRRPQRFTPAALDFMQKARWKGNVRELKNTVERLLIMTPGDTIDLDDLRDVVRVEAKPAVAGPEGGANHVAPGTLREFKESAERKFLVEKLRENAWNISKTAEVIGTPRSNLYKKLEQYAITQESDG
jgi:DNA-binding NtrC family response regulator